MRGLGSSQWGEDNAIVICFERTYLSRLRSVDGLEKLHTDRVRATNQVRVSSCMSVRYSRLPNMRRVSLGKT